MDPVFKIAYRGRFVQPLSWQLYFIKKAYQKYCKSNTKSICINFERLNGKYEYECVYGKESYIRNITTNMLRHIKTTWKGLRKEEWPMIIEVDEKDNPIRIARGWSLYYVRQIYEELSLEILRGEKEFSYHGDRMLIYIDFDRCGIENFNTEERIYFSIEL